MFHPVREATAWQWTGKCLLVAALVTLGCSSREEGQAPAPPLRREAAELDTGPKVITTQLGVDTIGMPGAPTVAPALRAAWIASEQARSDGTFELRRVGSRFEADNSPHGLRMAAGDGAIELVYDQGTRMLGGRWQPARASGDDVRLELRLQRWGALDGMADAPRVGSERADGNRYELERGEGLTEWYVNGVLGVEQGFTVKQLPDGFTGSELVLEVGVAGDANPQLLGASQVALRGASGAVWGNYGELFAKDASGAEVATHLSLGDGAIRLHVNVEGARLPVEIDPTIWVQEAKFIHEKNRTGGYFGQSAAVDGTTAVVGAVYDSSRGQPYAGTAYVFTRAGSAWTEQAELLPPDITGDMRFGMSVDVSGDTAVVGARGQGSITGGAYIFSRSGTTWTLQQKLLVPTVYFGNAVAVDGTTVFVGASNEQAVYVYSRSGTTWTQQQRLTSPGNKQGYGEALAVQGDTALVGDWGDSEVATYAGAVHVFTRSGTTWTEQKKLLASDAATDDNFGYSVALDGNTAAVGAVLDDDKGSGAGSAYVFVRSGTTWTQQQKLLASDGGPDDRFGWSVGLLGNTLVAGATYDFSNGSGSAYAFARTGTNWVQQQKLTSTSGNLGASSAVGVDLAIVGGFQGEGLGAGQIGDARVFTRSGVTWSEQAVLGPPDSASQDYMGTATALSGGTALVTAPMDDPRALDSGSAYIFALSGTAWTQQQKIYPTDSVVNANFGTAASLDANTAVVGAPHGTDSGYAARGAAYVFVRSGATWAQQQKLTPFDALDTLYFGQGVAVNGNTAAVGAPSNAATNGRGGAVYVYVRSGSTWTLQQRLANADPGDIGDFGSSVALQGDNLLAGEGYSGAVFVFTRSGTTWTQQAQLSPSGVNEGFAVSVALDGTTAVVGAPGANSNTGAAYVFVRSGASWTQQQKLTAATPVGSDYFGNSVAIVADTVYVGAQGDDTKAQEGGAVYVFTRAGTTWTLTKKLTAPDGTQGDLLGCAVAASGWRVLAGAVERAEPVYRAGAAYLFDFVDPLANGWGCLDTAACASGNCVDGFCCDTPCTATCQACAAALKGSGANGVCGPVAAGSDPENECALQPASSCGNTGNCNGANGCQAYPANTVCVAASCANQNAANNPDLCDGAGNCQDKGTTNCPNGYACVGTSCTTSCSGDFECATTHYCNTTSHTCVPDDPAGTSCTSTEHCASGYCVDGMCCSTICDQPCWSCSGGLTGGTNGTCAAVLADTDPLSDCTQDPASTCQRDGLCDGSGQCRPYYLSGTICGATTCSNDIVNGATCNGSGSCNLGTTPCFPYHCADSTSCFGNCTADTQCQPTAWCRVTDNTCQPDLAPGSTCTSPSQCLTGFCVDGKCCDGACNGTCVACSAAKKGAGADGICGSVTAGGDPDNECTDQTATTCGTTGACSGSGSCALYSPGTACGTTSCSNGVQTGNTCNGFGTCTPAGTSQCSPYTCLNAQVCATNCANDSVCIASAWCDTTVSQCKADKANGLTCTANSQCVSGFCIDGVCCDQACNGLCQACTTALKGAGANGVCGPVASGTDPGFECPDEGSASCQRNGQCNGAGACQLYTGGTACGSTTCTGGTQTGFACDGFGACQSAQSSQCTPYVCSGTTCATSCVSDQDCVGSYYCAGGGTCAPDQANGSVCATAGQCASGYCVDGVCCDSPCNSSVCQACSNTKKGSGPDGECAPVTAGTDPDAECADEGATTCGRDGACSGLGSCRLYSSGTACGSTTCSTGTQTGFSCNGLGTCQASQTTPCTPYTCDGSACGTTCASDLDCVVGAHCSAASTCLSDQANGAPCTSASQCVSGYCVDGVCCDQLCSGICQACTLALKGGGIDGECGPVAGGTDPANDCPVDPPSSCAKDGECNGSGACRLYNLGTACGSASCAGSTLTGYQCNGLGACVSGQSSSCGLYSCSSSSTCGVSCATNVDCVSSAFCAGGTCEQKNPDGDPCSSSGECGSGFCVDSVCCNTACDGVCQACAAVEKESGDNDGACGSAKVGGDPHDDCPDDGAISCDRNGTCDGSGQCALYAADVQCGVGHCEGNDSSGWTASSSKCDGNGACVLDVLSDCGLFVCGSGACLPSCAADQDCAKGAICTGTTCAPPKPLGETCGEGRECVSSLCVDGVCCDGPCNGQCEACDVEGALGKCVPVIGEPHGTTRPACAEAGGDPCTAATCNGSVRGSCAGFVTQEVICRTASCDEGVFTLSAKCNGSGACPEKVTAECTPYTCNGDACGSTCVSDDQCGSSFRCNTTQGKCIPRAAACIDDFTLKDADGKLFDCKPYRCEADACRDTCRKTEDCVTDFVCDDATKTCIPAASVDAAPEGDSGGCGCEVPGTGPSTPAAPWVLGAVAAVWLASRRGNRR